MAATTIASQDDEPRASIGTPAAAAGRRGTLRAMGDPLPRPIRRRRGVLVATATVVALVVVVVAVAVVLVRPPELPLRDQADGDGPPVLAGRQLWSSCAAGFYARRGRTIVLTSSAHCAPEGTTATDPDGAGVRGVFGPGAIIDPCPHEDHTCRPSDMNYLVVAPDRIPWGRLNLVDMGAGGLRVVEADTAPMSCADIKVGDLVEINGRDRYRSGMVSDTGEYLHDTDGDYFPCMIAAADVAVGVGDSGGAVLVGGSPAGVSSRSFDGRLGFTPLAEGLEALGLELCTTPDCGLDPS